MGRRATPEELAELTGGTPPPPAAGRPPTPEELAELGGAPSAPHDTPGPWREGFQGAGPRLLPQDSLPERQAPTGFLDRLGASARAKAPAAGYGFAQGITGGHVDELAGVGAISGDESGAIDLPAPGRNMATYDKQRNAVRGEIKGARAKDPVTYGLMNLLGTATSPLGRVGPGGAGLVAAVGRGVAQGAIYGEGESEGDSVSDIAEDTAIGAGAGGIFAGLATGAAKGVKYVAGKVKDSMGRRILNEAAEGTTSTTPTGRKKLDAAEEPIRELVVSDPRVRQAYQAGDVKKGRVLLRDVIDEADAAKEQGYQSFRAAGRGEVNTADYWTALKAKAQEARNAGSKVDADGLDALADDFEELVKGQTVPMDLRSLRRFTSDTQKAAAKALGGLNETGVHASLKRKLSGIASEAMDDAMTAQAKGVPELEEAAAVIRANNRKLNAALTIDDALKQRQYKENTGDSMLVRGAKKLAAPAMVGATAGAMGGDEDRVERTLEGAAIAAGLQRGIPGLARMADRGITSAAIGAARGAGPSAGQVATGARYVAPMFVNLGASMRKKRDEEEKRKREGQR